VIAILVEDEEDIAKFKDYTPSKADGAASESKKPSEPSPLEKETVQPPVSQPEPKISKPTQGSPAEDRVFASPLARKLAEDHNVQQKFSCSCSSDFVIPSPSPNLCLVCYLSV